jgi:hypothetical protein
MPGIHVLASFDLVRIGEHHAIVIEARGAGHFVSSDSKSFTPMGRVSLGFHF